MSNKPDGGIVSANRGIILRDLIALVRMAVRSYGTLGALAASPGEIAKDAYETADAMIAERDE